MLVRLIYASRAADDTDAKAVDQILERSRTHNVEHGITGVLCLCQSVRVFLQALEGSREEVNRLYGNIVRDGRHHDVTLLEYAEIGERRFARWQMGRVDMSKVNLSTVLRYSEKPTIDPYTMTGAAALALLEELTTSAAMVSRLD